MFQPFPTYGNAEIALNPRVSFTPGADGHQGAAAVQGPAKTHNPGGETLLPLSVPDNARPDLLLARRWFVLSVGSLLLAGLFALLLVIGRTPPLTYFISDPEFFKRCLVVHVILSLLVWFCAFTASLFCLLPGRRQSITQRSVAFPLALGGVGAMMAAAFLPGAAPVLSNYIPFIDHPVFAIGLMAFLAGLVLTYLSPQLPGSRRDRSETPILPPEAAAGVRVAAIATLVAVSTFLAAWAATPSTLGPAGFYELVAWGGGHVLQVANVAAMVTIWLVAIRWLQQRPVVSPRIAAVLFGLLLAPHLVAPLLTVNGTTTALYHYGSTQLMRWGIFPVVSIFLGLSVWRLLEARRNGRLGQGFARNFLFVGFVLSASMTVIGFILGAMIRSSNTMIPAHYHASIGAVTVAFMAMAFVLLNPFGLRLNSLRLRKLIPWQLGLFGGGQLVFALGFAIGGAYGLDRKAYGPDQQIASIGEYAGLAVMGIGGLIAVAGGILFLTLMAAAWRPQPAQPFSTQPNLQSSA